MLLLNGAEVASKPQEEPRYGGTLVMQLSRDPPHFNQGIIWDDKTTCICGNLYNGLVQYDENMIPHPELAEYWEISPDGKTFTFHLVKNATWHDGVKFTSADVKFTFLEVLKPYHPFGKVSAGLIELIETPDDYTVVFKLTKPSSLFASALSPPIAPILAKHYYEGEDILTTPKNNKPIGTGPFKFAEWVTGDHVTLVKNENYFATVEPITGMKGIPYLDKVIYRFIKDPMTAFSAIEKGEVDYIQFFTTRAAKYEVPRLEKVPGIKVVWGGLDQVASAEMLIMNCRPPHPTSDIRVRHAIGHAVDKEYIFETVHMGLGYLSTGPMHHKFPEYNPNVKKYEYDPEKANKLLDEAGYPRGPDGIRFKLVCPCEMERSDRVKTSEIIKEQLKKVGIDVKLEIAETTVVVERCYVKGWDFDLYVTGFAQGPWMITAGARYLTENIRPVRFTNCAGYSNPQVDELFKKAETELDFEKRKALLWEIQRIMVEDLPHIWIQDVKDCFIYRTEFQGFDPLGKRPWGGHHVRTDIVWWTKGKLPAPTPAPGPEVSPYLVALVVLPIIAIILAVYAFVKKRKR